MKFKAPGNEDLMVAITTGHSIVISPKGTETPARFRKEAIARGCIPMGVGAEKEDPAADEDQRSDLIRKGIDKLLDSDDGNAFTAAGNPNLTKLNAVLGFKASREEVDAIWKEMAPGSGEETGEEEVEEEAQD